MDALRPRLFDISCSNLTEASLSRRDGRAGANPRLMYERETSEKLDPKYNRQMLKVRQRHPWFVVLLLLLVIPNLSNDVLLLS